jgi:heptosyltransferase-3
MLRRNVLIFHAGALGDFILTWPIAMAALRIFAQSRVFYVTQSEKGKLAERVLGTETKDAEAGWHHLFADPANLPDPARRTLEGAQLIINFVAKDSDPWTANARSASHGAEIVTIDPTPNSPIPNPILAAATDQMNRSILKKGVRTLLLPGPDIVLHPGSGSREKCWPLDHWLQLIPQLPAPARILLGEVERDRFSPSDIAKLQSLAPVRYPATYTDLLAELSTARCFIGNDSGPAHLAGIIGLPTLAIFGPTDPSIWRPLGPHVQTLRSPTPSDVLETVQSLLSTPTNSPPPVSADDVD